MLKYIEPDRIYFKWEDKRQINGNEGRNVSCTSKHVEWTTEGQFWVPRIDVWDVIELVGLQFVLVFWYDCINTPSCSGWMAE